MKSCDFAKMDGLEGGVLPFSRPFLYIMLKILLLFS